jgi:hypothetical protein
VADDWYLFDGLRKLGPFSLVEAKLQLETLGSPGLRVWREGSPDSVTPADVPEFAPAIPPPLPPEARHDPAPAASAKTWHFNNFVARNWRGEYSLAKSYWLFGLLGSGLAIDLFAIIFADINSETYNPRTIFAGILLDWLFVVAMTVWQLVGIWRSASRHIKTRRLIGKRSPWAHVARVAVCLSALRLAAALVNSGGPQLWEVARMSFLGDPDIPAYAMRTMRDGAEAEIAGGFKYGLTNDFQKLLSTSGKLRVVHLDSIGGRAGEAIALNQVIRANGLDTYVSSKCMSACTIAFAGGTRRILRKGAVLGFHAASFPGMTKEGIAAESKSQKSIFLAAGFDEKFVDQALSTPNSELWEPAESVLLQAGAITAVSDGDDFALSGVGVSPTKADFGAMLSNELALMGPLKKRFPSSYDLIVQAYFDGFQSGKTGVESIAAVGAALQSTLNQLKPLADNDVLADLAAVFSDQYRALGAKSTALCYQYASGAVDAVAISELPAALIARENDINKRIVETAASRAPGNEASLKAAWKKVGATLASQGVNTAQLELLNARSVPADKYGDYCAAATTFFREISRLPQDEAGAIMRAILAEK